MNGAQSVFQRREEPQEHHVNAGSNGSCGSGNTSQRDELLTKIAGAKRPE
jgi:hypothetical protein